MTRPPTSRNSQQEQPKAKADHTSTDASVADRASQQLTALSSTDLDVLFDTCDTPVTGGPAADTPQTVRVRRVLERSGGDYSRFVPPRVGSRRKNASDSPAILTARHALATQRDVSIRRRRMLLHIVGKLAQSVGQVSA
jgi:hypothetical protein